MLIKLFNPQTCKFVSVLNTIKRRKKKIFSYNTYTYIKLNFENFKLFVAAERVSKLLKEPVYCLYFFFLIERVKVKKGE